MALTGILGGPLEYVKGLFNSCPNLTTFTPDGNIYTYQRVGPKENEDDLQAGDAWILITWAKSGFSLKRDGAGKGLASYGVRRAMDVQFARCITELTEAVKDDFINDVGTVVKEFIEAEDSEAISTVQSDGALEKDENGIPVMLGMRFTVEVNIE